MLEHIQRNQDCSADRGLYLYEKYSDEPRFAGYRNFPDYIAGYAAYFNEQGVRRGTRVLFPFETSLPSIYSFLGLIEIGAIPLSVKPLIMNTPTEAYSDFLARVARDFRAERILATPSMASVNLPCEPLALPPEDTREPGALLRTPADDELAFVQFSSGSTSFPKGIPVRQDKLRANLSMIVRTDGRKPEERVSSWLPLYHDMGLVGGMLSCLVSGGDLLLAEPTAFLFDPHGWWAHMAGEKAAGTVIPNFAIDYSLKLMQELDPEEIAAIDLSGVRSIYLGSEPVNVRNLETFLDLMAPAGLRRDVFMPCYGMAEAVLLVSSRPLRSTVRVVTSPAGIPVISVGRPLPEFNVRLRTEDGRCCGENQLGEIELSGGTLATSYFDGSDPLAGDDGYYATGDIGFMNEGELFITGRSNDRIKVGGQSFFATDFEHALERLPFVREGRTAVLQIDRDIVVLAEVDREAREDIAGSRKQIVRHLIATVGVTVEERHVHYLRPGQLPRTSSGKLQRLAIADAYRLRRLTGVTFDHDGEQP